MRMLMVPQMADVLTHLSEANQMRIDAGRQLSKVTQPYEVIREELRKKVADLQDEVEQAKTAMMEDPTVILAVEKAEQAAAEYDKTLEQAQAEAAQAWRDMVTDGSKQWLQSGYEIKLWTTRRLVITDAMAMLEHLAEIEAMSTVKRVNVSLNRKKAMALREVVKVPGLEIDEELRCHIAGRQREVSDGE